MASIHRSSTYQAARARDRALIRLRRVRQLVVVVVAAASLGFTVLAARAFPGHHARSHASETQQVASLNPPKWTHRPAPRRHHHRHVAAAAATAPATQAAPAASPPPQPVAPPPAPVQAAPPPAPAPVAPAPAPTPQPPVVTSGGS